MRATAGFSLAELLVTLAIASVVLALATPNFQVLREEWALRSATHAVLGGLAEARLGALSRGSEGRLCPSQDGARCAPRGSGFVVSAGPAGASSTTLRASTLPPLVELSGNRPAATYYAWPRAALPVTLTLCAVGQHARSRRVIVSQTGRPRVVRGAAC